jgi:hypothetical protein
MNNTKLLKHYYQPLKRDVKGPENEAPTPKTSPLPPANRKYVKKVYGGRPDGGPTTRSKAKTAGMISPQAKVVHLDQILPHNETIQSRLDKDTTHKRLKRDIPCLYGYSSKPKECDVVGDIAEFSFNPIVAVIKASKGPKYQDNKKIPNEKGRSLRKANPRVREGHCRTLPKVICNPRGPNKIIFRGTFDNQTTTDDFNSQTTRQTKDNKTRILKRKIKPY